MKVRRLWIVWVSLALALVATAASAQMQLRERYDKWLVPIKSDLGEQVTDAAYQRMVNALAQKLVDDTLRRAFSQNILGSALQDKSINEVVNDFVAVVCAADYVWDQVELVVEMPIAGTKTISTFTFIRDKSCRGRLPI